MNAIEDRLSAAGRAVAVTVPPDSAPPLRLPAPAAPEAGLRGPGWRRPGRRRPGWLAPLAAAAAVVAVIAMALAITRGLFSGAPAGPEAGPVGTPPYSVSLTSAAGEAGAVGTAVVRLTATGVPVARVAPPGRGDRFTMVAAARDDRTFVLGSQLAMALTPMPPASSPAASSGGPAQMAGTSPAGLVPATRTVFYLLRFDPVGRQARLSQLHVPAAMHAVSGLALSPDGRKLAVATAPPGQMQITVSSLASGTSRTWTGRWDRHIPAPAFNSLSWTSSGQLAFAWRVPGSSQKGMAPDTVVRLLDVTAPETSLRAASTEPGQYAGLTSTALSPQGVQIQFETGSFPNGGVAEYPTGQRSVFLSMGSAQGSRQAIAGTPHVLWSNPAGTVLITNIFGREIDVVGLGRFVKLPGTMPADPRAIAW